MRDISAERRRPVSGSSYIEKRQDVWKGVPLHWSGRRDEKRDEGDICITAHNV